MTRPTAVVVVTGSELVRGERTDLNGPFLASEALRLGLEPIRVAIVGDAPAELEATLRAALADGDAVLVSGGLGPTHDDRTVELVARALGVGLHVDSELESQIEAVSRAAAVRLRRDYADFAPGVTKQATVPDGAISLGLAGTAPGLLVPREGDRVAVVLPGPPSELRRLWPNALEQPAFRALLARTVPPERRVRRLFGVSESAVARALDQAGGDGDGVEVTICARDFEIHVDLVVEPGAEARADALEQRFFAPLEDYLYGHDERGVEEHVLDLCRARGLTLATAESCTGGLVAARLTSVPGSSDVVLGGVVAYANEVKERELGVPADVLAEHGAVSAEVAAALARGARERLGADVAVSVTGVAGPGGGTPEKPVGLVYLHAEGPDGSLAREFDFPGDRASIRARSVVIALHLVRTLLTRSSDDSV
ncbi:MAG TPA: CinA family nicotinamide mononucleotide deamidase-related protein [Gaiellaceae bacterium]|nr:CinA family nicotinamide mononucleotide deamidase-related protein [Gaiellaceae bacterium]